MIKSINNGIEYYTFTSFPADQVICACFSRKGGVSPNPWKSLNVGGTVGDSEENVSENRSRVFSTVNRNSDSLYDVWQVHGTEYKIADKPRDLKKEHEKADIILTQNNSLTLLMRFADCVPIFLFDPENKAIAIAHAGWKGTLNKIAEKTVNAMVRECGTDPKKIISGIGPSIGPDHYVIGDDLAKKVTDEFPDHVDTVVNRKNNNQLYLNLWELNSIILRMAGVQKIEIAEICTACSVEDWYSHRGEKGRTGRFGAMIALK